MRIAIRILVILTIMLVVLLTGSYFYLRTNGKNLIIANIHKYLDREVDFKEFHVSYPLTVHIKDFNIKDLGGVKKLSMSLSLLGLLSRQVRISHLIIEQAHWRIVQDKGKTFQWDHNNREPAISSENKKDKSQKISWMPLGLFIAKTNVSASRIIFYERSLESKGEELLLELKNIDLSLTPIVFPFDRPLKTKFECIASISGYQEKFNQDPMKALGWFDLFSKDMQVDIAIEGMQGQAKVIAHLDSEKNDMKVHGQMNLAFDKISKREKPKSLEDFFVDALKDNNAQMTLNFRFQTKMDHFEIEKVSLSGSLDKSVVEEELLKD
jgi:uncharacterized protein involved in outer membrane biogenesis